MKKVLSLYFLLSLLIFVNLYAESKLSIDINPKASFSQKSINLYKDLIFGSDASEKYVENQIKLSKLFAKAYIKKYSINKIDRDILKLQLLRALSLMYINKLKQLHKPSEEVLKSYYLDHIDSFNPITKVSMQILTEKSLKKADEIYLKIKNDHKLFLDFIKKEDNDPVNRYKTYFKNVSLMTFVPTVREWIRDHKKGDISKPIKVGSYFLICKLLDKQKPNKSYKTLKDSIKKRLLSMYMMHIVRDEYKRLSKESEK